MGVGSVWERGGCLGMGVQEVLSFFQFTLVILMNYLYFSICSRTLISIPLMLILGHGSACLELEIHQFEHTLPQDV